MARSKQTARKNYVPGKEAAKRGGDQERQTPIVRYGMGKPWPMKKPGVAAPHIPRARPGKEALKQIRQYQQAGKTRPSEW